MRYLPLVFYRLEKEMLFIPGSFPTGTSLLEETDDGACVAENRFCGNSKECQKHAAFQGNAIDGKQITDKEYTDQKACQHSKPDQPTQFVHRAADFKENHQSHSSH